MNIVHVCNSTFPARDQQGTQRVVQNIIKGQIHNGHNVKLIANRDSKLDFVEIIDGIPKNTDIVHLNGGSFEDFDLRFYDRNWVRTIHGGGQDARDKFKGQDEYHYICISNTIRKYLSLHHFVHNCIDPSETIYNKNKEDYFLWIGGTDWGEQKGLFSAIELARKLNLRLVIAGTGRNTDILNKLNARTRIRNIDFIGPVNGKEKAKLIANAKGLFMVGRILDGCPLTSIEALMSGTPVIARNIEIHEEMLNDEVGFICKTDNEIVKATLSVGKIKPEKCREYALEKFSHIKKAQDYIDVYQKVLQSI